LRRPRFSKKSALLTVLLAAVVFITVASFVKVDIYRINMTTDISSMMQNPTIAAFAQVVGNSTGNVMLSLQNFNYTTSDNATKVSATTATISVVLTPQGAQDRMDLDVKFSGVSMATSTFTGKFDSVQLTGFVVVDPAANKIVTSLVASTSVLDIMRGILGI
jgi:hypothetical protein